MLLGRLQLLICSALPPMQLKRIISSLKLAPLRRQRAQRSLADKRRVMVTNEWTFGNRIM